MTTSTDIWSKLGLANVQQAVIKSMSWEQLDLLNAAYNRLGTALANSNFSNVSVEKAREFVAFIDEWLVRIDSAHAYLLDAPADENGRVNAQDEADWQVWFQAVADCTKYTTDVAAAVESNTPVGVITDALKGAKKAAGEVFDLSWVPWVVGAGVLLGVFMLARPAAQVIASYAKKPELEAGR